MTNDYHPSCSNQPFLRSLIITSTERLKWAEVMRAPFCLAPHPLFCAHAGPAYWTSSCALELPKREVLHGVVFAWRFIDLTFVIVSLIIRCWIENSTLLCGFDIFIILTTVRFTYLKVRLIYFGTKNKKPIGESLTFRIR